MHFQRGVINSEIHALTFTNQADGSQGILPLSFPYQQTVVLPHSQNSFSLNRLGLEDLSAVEAVTQTWSLGNGEDSVKVSEQTGLDELSALVQKCKAREPSFSLDRSPLSLYAPQRSSPRLDCKNGLDITQQLHLSKRRRVNGEESLKGKPSCGGYGLSSSRENHILSERLRRSEMNHLFAQMFSLLPSPPAKVDKASILSETINYIQSLQRRLAVHFEKPASRLLSNQTAGIKSKKTLVLETDRNPSCTGNLTLNCNGQDMLITMNCKQKAKLLPSIILVLETHNMHVMDAFVTTTDTGILYCLHVKAEKIPDNATKETLHHTLYKFIE